MIRPHSSNHRFLPSLIALSVATLGVAGCSSAGGGDTSTQGPDTSPVELRFAVHAELAASFTAITEAYTEEFPNVTFQIDEVPVTNYGEVLRTQMIGGNPPDLFYATGGSGFPESVLPLAEAGYLAPLNGTAAEELLTPATRPLYEAADGNIYGQPIDLVPWINIVNLTSFEDTGLEAASTYDELLANCATATAAGKSLINMAGSSVNNPANVAMQVSAARVYAHEPDWNERRAAGEVTFAESEGWQHTLETIVDLNDSGCFQPGVEAGTTADTGSQVASGQSIGVMSIGSVIGALSNLNPDATFAAQVFPGDTAADTTLFLSPTNALAVSEASEQAQKAAALAFLDWMAEPANSQAYADLTGNISIRAEGGELPPQYSALASVIEDGQTQPVASAFWPNSEVYTTLGSGVQGILTGQASISDVLESMDSAWDR